VRRAGDASLSAENEARWGGVAPIEDAVRFADLRAHHHTATANDALDDDADDRWSYLQ